MDDPEVTVVIPVYNNAGTIVDQLEGLRLGLALAPATELVVVDNRSTDGSPDVVRSWSESTGVPVLIVDAHERAGEPYARNVGLTEASGRHILYCDGDDVVDPGWIVAMSEGLERWPYVTGPVLTDALNEPWLTQARGSALFEGIQKLHDAVPYAHGCNMGFRREVLEQLGGFDESFLAGCDQAIAIAAWEQGLELGFVDGAIVQYRLRPDLGSTFRQGRSYGRYRVRVRRLVPDLVDRGALARAHTRRIGWLVKHSISALRRPEVKARWVWVASQLLGEAEGAIEVRRGK